MAHKIIGIELRKRNPSNGKVTELAMLPADIDFSEYAEFMRENGYNPEFTITIHTTYGDANVGPIATSHEGGQSKETVFTAANG